MNMGEIFTLSYYQDIPWVLAAGGSKGELAIWDTEESEQISKHFTPFLDRSKIQSIDEDDEDEEVEEADSDSDMEETKKKKKSKKSEGKKEKKDKKAKKSKSK
jgi:hypothetical protein